MKTKKIMWWSAGITSAVAGKISLEIYNDVDLYYIETGSAHVDNERFKIDCEKWYGKEIITVQNKRGFTNHFDVIRRERYVNGPEGAKCTKELKKNVRYVLEDQFKDCLSNQIFGYEFEKKQVNRALRFLEQYPAANALFPLIEKGLDKNNCAGLLLNQNIKLPVMYELGYSNNNCIGCVKGGKGYWNKIRVDFPEVFDEMAKAEREIGHSCIRKTFLDELNPKAGRNTKPVLPNCGNFCEIDFADIPHKSLESVMSGVISIYDAVNRKAS